jgi:4-hydroxy-tetrahydrodipicolinate synthase
MKDTIYKNRSLYEHAPMRGVYAIPPAVYHENMEVDYEGIRKCVKFCLDCQVHGIVVPVYATDYFILSDEERKKIVEITLDEVAGRIPVVVGVSHFYAKFAVDLAKHACAAGADAVIAAPPHVVKVRPDELFDYYKAINDAVSIPIHIQNLFPPLGSPMTFDFLIRLIDELEWVSYIKEETANSNQLLIQMSKHKRANPNCGLVGVMGGKGARDIFEEYDRGICGTMPPSQFADVIVEIWNLLENDKRQEAYELYLQALPALVFGGNYSVGCYRHILKRRGVIDYDGSREAGWPKMDEYSMRQLDLIMENIRPILKL